MNLEELKQFCFLKKGRGKNMFCIKQNCTTAHQGPKLIVPVLPGECFVTRDKDTSFIRPLVDSNLLEDQLVQDWLPETKEQEEWTDLMDTVLDKVKRTDITQGQKIKVSPKGLENQTNRRAKAIVFKTPRSKRDLIEEKVELETTEVPEQTPIEAADTLKKESIDDDVEYC